MESTLTIVFQEETVLCALFETGGKGLQLVDVAAFPGPYDVLADGLGQSGTGSKLIEYVLTHAHRINSVRVVLPSTAVFSQILPYIPSSNQQQVTDLLEMELMQCAPETGFQEYRSVFFPLRSLRGNGALMLAVLHRRRAEQNLRELFAQSGMPTCEFVVRHSAAHAAFMYSYPERAADAVILINVDSTRCEITVLHERVMIFFNVLPYTEAEAIADLLAHEIEENILPGIEAAAGVVLYGDKLTPSLLSMMENRLGSMVSSVQRCNAFRMCTTLLDEEQRTMASRMAHRFAANVGSVVQRREASPVR